MPGSKRYVIERRKRHGLLQCFKIRHGRSEDAGPDNIGGLGITPKRPCDTDDISSFSMSDSNKEGCDQVEKNVEERDEYYETQDNDSDISESSTVNDIVSEHTPSICSQTDGSLTPIQDQELVKEIEEKENEIQRLKEAVGKIALNPTYIKLSRCENVIVNLGEGDIDQQIEQIRIMLDSLCEKFDKLKGTGETILAKVEEIHGGSADQHAQLKELVERLQSVFDAPSSPMPADKKQDSQYCSLSSLVHPETMCQDGEDCKCVVWGPSNVLKDLKDTQVKILNRLDSMEDASKIK